MEKLSESRIQKVLANHRNTPFTSSTNFMVIPNVSWGFFSWGEADLIAISKAGYLTEGEVKLTISDFKADKKKKKFNGQLKQWTKDIKKHYYIVPENIKEECLKMLKDSNSGLLYVEQFNYGLHVNEAKTAKVNKLARKLDSEELLKLARLISFRFWSR